MRMPTPTCIQTRASCYKFAIVREYSIARENNMNIRLSDPHHALACPQFLLVALTKTTQPTRFGMTSAIQPHDLITFEPVI